VALKYDPEKGGAPMLLAKGSDFTALKIREIAVANDILLVESSEAAYVYQIRQYRAGKGKRPDPLKDLPIPPDLRRDS
jgi:flagellar biosynthetic protein FlhB